MTSSTIANQSPAANSDIKRQRTVSLIKSDVQFAAHKAGLSYVSDQTPGMRPPLSTDMGKQLSDTSLRKGNP